ncbi:signal recognition particle-docking protein FtsY [Myxococcota bacterium]|nr:signal recognition particle-docking protein FtsY [Myxococcota bacterium]MBU1536610.1 signal recognition particle-docking protein FtsY [Myxococcota bacterium]
MSEFFAPAILILVCLSFVYLAIRFTQKIKAKKRELGYREDDSHPEKQASPKSGGEPAKKQPKKAAYETAPGERGEKPETLQVKEKPVASPVEKALKEKHAPVVEAEVASEPVAATPKLEEEPEEEPEVKPEQKAPKTLKEGLKKTRGSFISRLGKLLSFKKEIDEEILEELEVLLFTADIGPTTAEKLFETVKENLSRKELNDQETVWNTLKQESIKILDIPQTGFHMEGKKPFVILVIGVNGVGKTTTIGKLASHFKAQGKSVLLAAGDTFRAAAIDQLAIWAKERVGCEIVKGKEGSDPSSVIFDAVKQAEKTGIDVVIADTAGRLHTQTNLMDELQKVRRVCNKAYEGAPHETFLVLDATNGQNALHQAEEFMKVMDFTGIIITKMDGTAKGGVILGICDKMKVPVRFIGIGEQVEDLRSFDATAFTEALFEHEEE